MAFKKNTIISKLYRIQCFKYFLDALCTYVLCIFSYIKECNLVRLYVVACCCNQQKKGVGGSEAHFFW